MKQTTPGRAIFGSRSRPHRKPGKRPNTSAPASASAPSSSHPWATPSTATPAPQTHGQTSPS